MKGGTEEGKRGREGGRCDSLLDVLQRLHVRVRREVGVVGEQVDHVRQHVVGQQAEHARCRRARAQHARYQHASTVASRRRRTTNRTKALRFKSDHYGLRTATKGYF